eukprot:TRINITY_DN103543_c0_g1_i1.p2 TRINITY_DN103543_c0_g1~~TRINITY_DN103543_c0_g1_i1.p2  ORF type:complete len:120 (+),score=21.50 TRINITY_DN103543_c0_g1_i1:235-594(+)
MEDVYEAMGQQIGKADIEHKERDTCEMKRQLWADMETEDKEKVDKTEKDIHWKAATSNAPDRRTRRGMIKPRMRCKLREIQATRRANMRPQCSGREVNKKKRDSKKASGKTSNDEIENR